MTLKKLTAVLAVFALVGPFAVPQAKAASPAPAAPLSPYAAPEFAGTMLDSSGLTLDPKIVPPPAWAIAKHMADRKDWGDAVRKLSDIQGSASYRGTPYVPEAIYTIAHIDEDHLSDTSSAINQFNTLHNSFLSVPYTYPHESVVDSERDALGKKIDDYNRAVALKGPSDWGSLPLIWQSIEATGYLVIDYAVRLTGSRSWSYPFALLLIAVTVRLLLWPLTIKQYRSMKEMQRLNPLLKDLKAKYANDPTTFQAKQMELFKEHNVNPAAGCFPLILQMPVFFYMYHAVWLYQYRFGHGTFLWITPSLHKLAPAIFGASLADPDLILLLLYSFSMYITQRMMPATDPAQADMMKQQALMSAFIFFFIFQNNHFPSAFVLYWLFSNIVSTCVQVYAMRSGAYMLAPLKSGTSPADGDPEQLNGTSNGRYANGAGPDGNVVEGSFVDSKGTGRVGTAKGVIAPAKVHPKKKKR